MQDLTENINKLISGEQLLNCGNITVNLIILIKTGGGEPALFRLGSGFRAN